MVSQRTTSKSAESKTIRVSAKVYDDLTALASASDNTLGETVSRLLVEHDRAEIHRQMREGYRLLREDRAAWEEYLAEAREWDNAPLDQPLDK